MSAPRVLHIINHGLFRGAQDHSEVVNRDSCLWYCLCGNRYNRYDDFRTHLSELMYYDKHPPKDPDAPTRTL